jgi:cation:H+ antiporter
MDPAAIASLAAGLIVLVLGAEIMVGGASRLAAALGISPLVIGLTVVAFGTSSPELAVNLQGVAIEDTNIGLGNILGSSIFNILVILGIAAIINPLKVAQQLVRLDIPVMIGVSILVYLFSLDGWIGRLEGALLILGLVAYILFLLKKCPQECQEVKDEYAHEFGTGPLKGARAWLRNIGLVVIGLTMLTLGSRWLVNGAEHLAQALGLSQLIIGITIVALGTSLPEVATSIIAAVRGERDIAAGNAIGSNIFNILSVLGLTSLASPDGIFVPEPALTFDFPVMIAVAIAALPIFFTGNVIARWEGWLLLGYYVIYTLYLVLNASQHDSLPLFSKVMFTFVLPLTILTLLIFVVREFRTRRKLNVEVSNQSERAE